jgi:hypothetical protein
LALNCPFAKEVWSKFQGDHPRAVLMANRSFTLTAWWKKLRRGRTDERLRCDISLSVYVIWHIWKERGRRIFQNASMPAIALVTLIKSDLALLKLARGVPGGVIVTE